MFSEANPLGTLIKVKRIVEEQKTASGIYIPEEADEFSGKIYKAKVLDIGNDVKFISKGNVVLCKFHTGIEIDYDIILVEEKEILGKF